MDKNKQLFCCFEQRLFEVTGIDVFCWVSEVAVDFVALQFGMGVLAIASFLEFLEADVTDAPAL